MISNPPVTVDVMQSVRPGKDREFETLLEKIIGTASTFEGYLGSSIFRPNEQNPSEYRIIFKFDRLENLKRWESSPARQRFLSEAKQLTVSDGTFSIITGLETWFTLPAKPGVKPPARYKMVVVSGVAIFAINRLLALLPTAWLALFPPLVQLLIAVFITTALMTYVVMPRLTKLLAGWLYPQL
ncbi:MULTISPECIES: antibiotic biosynthesis monooxygenase [Cyanophyceae]|uniref:antibiotic biosynthesis monooxygenase n=1 Tax=Cyanophyceae TaxID=3028117 RepID=UPI0016870FB9|nr:MULTISPECIES: antibiotic biosynthesis monooxygenase [Cyanophyceae]MBD1915639.1 antibiotic biosynthesis monooxygenase [Phormidium sp. FACHB-77]MBD2031949.1 antibiotic biosynthesis monooxygenase [Phormidium sp. FACHB-322]MBD2050699.1 antibiotic biosynthesis monooxygenase [Leptolyngbya sp. FACHB-60]